MRTLVITEEMEATAREVLGFPYFRPGASVPSFMRRQFRLLEFVRLMADAVLGTSTPPIVLEKESEAPAPPPVVPTPRRQVATGGPLTRPQQDALARMPADWFSSESLSHAIHAADGMCQRLVKKGALEERSACPPGTNYLEWVQRTPHTRYYEYRKVKPAAPEAAPA